MSQARYIAFKTLLNVAQSRQTLDYWLEVQEPRIAELNRPDRAFVHALIYGVLRRQGQLDWIADALLKKPGKKIDPPVRIILRMGLFQIFHMDRIPPSAAVNTSVDLAKTTKYAWAAGFINGVLRQAVRNKDRLPYPREDRNLVAAITVAQSFPAWLITRWLDRYGPAETKALCEAINDIPLITLRTNTLKRLREQLVTDITSEATIQGLTSFSPEGIRISSFLKPLNQWPAYQQGFFQVQDEAAQLVTHFLAPQPGQRIWDVCAGLGTKTAHAAQLMRNQGHILATDFQTAKLDRLINEMKRLGVDIVETRTIDLSSDIEVFRLPMFDRILVDAPCSGMGVLRKNPDTKWRINSADLIPYSTRQKYILTRAGAHLKPDGILVYAVCSFEPEETILVVDDFLHKNPDFAIYRNIIPAVQNVEKLQTAEGYLCTMPHRHGMDGFFAAAFVKRPLTI